MCAEYISLKELEIRNEVFDLGLTPDDMQILTDERDSENAGDRYLLKKGKIIYGFSHKSDEVIITDTEIVKSIPCLMASGWKLYFEISKADTEHLENLQLESNYTPPNQYHSGGIKNKTAKNIADLKTKIKEHLLGTSPYASSLSPQNIKAYFWLFDEQEPPIDFFEDKRVNKDIEKILKVFEYENHRFYLYTKNRYSSSVFELKHISHKEPEYNYIDENRLFIDKLFVWDIEEKDLDYSTLCECEGNRYEFLLVDKKLYSAVEKKKKLKQKKEEEDYSLHEAVRKDIGKKLDNLGCSSFEKNGITFSKDGIFYQGQQITGTINTHKPEVDVFGLTPNPFNSFYSTVFRDDPNPDFNTLYEKFIETKIGDNEFEGILGQIKVQVRIEINKTTRYFINNIRINKNEVQEMLIRAICFDDVAKYNDLLKNVSKCNLKFHDLLSKGLLINFIGEGKGCLKLKIVRKAGRNYLEFKNTLYNIKDTNRLLAKSSLNKDKRNNPRFSEVITLFETLFKFDTKQLSELFKEGLKEYTQAIKKSEEFLANAIKLFKVSEIEKDGETGYLIKGMSGKKYFLTDKLKIYDYNTGRYLCVVDKDLGNGFINDRIVNRIYALANDKLIAEQVSTLR